MAVSSAANSTFTPQNRPSIFEIIAQETLNETLHPALQKIALVLSTSFPQRFQWLGDYYDEVFLVVSGLVQYTYLKNHNATFSESFYGLQRIPINGTQMSLKHKLISLTFSTFLPYFRRKLEQKLTIYRLEHADGFLSKRFEMSFKFQSNFQDNSKKILIHSHATFEVVWGLLTVYNYIKYMSETEDAQLPILKLIGLKLIYAEPEAEGNSPLANILSGNVSMKTTSRALLEGIAFFLQFLQVWNEKKGNYSLTALPRVEPPEKVTNYKDKCPICLQYWKIPTVLPVSGYVFCFPCILRHLRTHLKCPVTGYPARPLDIIRLYDE